MALNGTLAALWSRLQRWVLAWVLGVLRRHARIPKHVAFVMDGNRRYADKTRLAKRTDGHAAGSAKLEEVLSWCVALDIRVVTVYAFSVENFRRSPEEVSALMALALERFAEFAEKSELVRSNRVGIRVVGELDMLPEDVRRAALRAMSLTRDNDKHVLQICFPYASRAEILCATREALLLCTDDKVHVGHAPNIAFGGSAEILRSSCDPKDIPSASKHFPLSNAAPDFCSPLNSASLNDRLDSEPPCDELATARGMATAMDDLVYTSADKTCAAHPPDLIVRTSGESRLSEFLTWQVAAYGPMLAFARVLWPDFGLGDFLSVLMRYHLRAGGCAQRACTDRSQNWASFVSRRRDQTWDVISGS